MLGELSQGNYTKQHEICRVSARISGYTGASVEADSLQTSASTVHVPLLRFCVIGTPGAWHHLMTTTQYGEVARVIFGLCAMVVRKPEEPYRTPM